jgi:hypothetical protein
MKIGSKGTGVFNYKHLIVNYFARNKNLLIFASRFKKNTAFLVHKLISKYSGSN